MKRIYITFIITIITCSLLTVSCKRENIAPDKTTTGNTNKTTANTNTTPSWYGTPDGFPFRVSELFLPTGFYGTGDGGSNGKAQLAFNNTDSLWLNSHADFTVTNTVGWGGFAFLSNNDWTDKYRFAPGATKLTYDVKADVGVKIVVTAFAGATSINQQDTYTSTDANAWVTRTISFTGTYPDSLTAPNFAALSFSPPPAAVNGTIYKFSVRNMVLDK